VLERGEPGDVLVQHVVLACFGGQRPQLLDGGVQIAGGPQYGGVEDQAERAPSWSSCPVRYACMICPRLPWQMSRASLWRDSWTVSCRFICLR